MQPQMAVRVDSDALFLLTWPDFARSERRYQDVTLDYQPPRQPLAPKSKSSLRLPLLLGLGILLLGSFFFFDRPAVTTTEASTSPPPEFKAPPSPKITREIISDEVSSGDTITSLLGGYLSPQEIHNLGQESKKVFPLSRICSGQPYKLCVTDAGFESFEYDIDRDEQLIIKRLNDQFDINKVPIEYQVEVDQVRGTITSSLFEAVTDSGESPELALALADIFAWDVDFILDIRTGDSFQALVEKRFRDGKPAGYGRILAAEFTNRGEHFMAFLFADGEKQASYYDENGKSVRKAFLKAPLRFDRISSGFTMKRFHPIAKTWRAHPAIDYAAPTGTPIKTVGDGVVSRKGYTKGNGNFVEIRHNSSYKTLYLHMSKFGRGIKQGARVSQGQTIGYVGSTGLATGPHLCFRMYKNNSPVNPTRIKAPASAPISKENQTAFNTLIAPFMSSLAGNDPAIDLKAEVAPADAGSAIKN